MYDRMNPNINELIQRLEDYSKIDYGKNAYELSTAEAKLILDEYKQNLELIEKMWDVLKIEEIK